MKELKVVLLVLAIGFGSSVPASTKFPYAYYPNTIKGGLQTSQKHESDKLADLGVEGNYEYYLQYVRFKLDYDKSDEEETSKKSLISPACVLAKSRSASC